jgi:hypothetical protein
MFYTYLWLRYDGTPYYVGKRQRDRGLVKARHRVDRPHSKRFILIQEHPCEADAFAAEMFLIAYYGRADLGKGCLRNLSDGGEGESGRVFTEQHKANIRASALNRKVKVVQSEETREKHRKQKRLKHTDEAKQKIREATAKRMAAKYGENRVRWKGKKKLSTLANEEF